VLRAAGGSADGQKKKPPLFTAGDKNVRHGKPDEALKKQSLIPIVAGVVSHLNRTKP